MKASETLLETAIAALEELKAERIRVIETAGLTSLFDTIVIASATSTRKTRALAGNVQEKVKAAGGTIYGTEGEQTGEWVLVDLGDIVIHVMQPAIRDFYDLESLWSNVGQAISEKDEVAQS